MEHVDQLLLAGVVPLALVLLQLQDEVLQLAVLDQMVAQFMRVLSFPDLPRHYLYLEGKFLLLSLKGSQGLLHHAAVSTDHLLNLREVVHNGLVLLPFVKELESVVCEPSEVGVRSSESGLELLNGLEDSLVGLFELG